MQGQIKGFLKWQLKKPTFHRLRTLNNILLRPLDAILMRDQHLLILVLLWLLLLWQLQTPRTIKTGLKITRAAPPESNLIKATNRIANRKFLLTKGKKHLVCYSETSVVQKFYLGGGRDNHDYRARRLRRRWPAKDRIAAAIAAEKSVFRTVWLGFRMEEGEKEKGRDKDERKKKKGFFRYKSWVSDCQFHILGFWMEMEVTNGPVALDRLVSPFTAKYRQLKKKLTNWLLKKS